MALAGGVQTSYLPHLSEFLEKSKLRKERNIPAINSNS
jgi:hypothetical protein